MPPLARWYIKTSFIYLALALLTGLLIAFQAVLDLPALGGLFPVYIHLYVLAWPHVKPFGM